MVPAEGVRASALEPTPKRLILGITSKGVFYWRQDVGDSAKHFVTQGELKAKVEQHKANYSECEFYIDDLPESAIKNVDTLLAELKILGIDNFRAYIRP